MTNRITIIIDCDNAAFEDGVFTEVSRILRNAAVKIEASLHWNDFTQPLFDLNGNRCGAITASHGEEHITW